MKFRHVLALLVLVATPLISFASAGPVVQPRPQTVDAQVNHDDGSIVLFADIGWRELEQDYEFVKMINNGDGTTSAKCSKGGSGCWTKILEKCSKKK